MPNQQTALTRVTDVTCFLITRTGGPFQIVQTPHQTCSTALVTDGTCPRATVADQTDAFAHMVNDPRQGLSLPHTPDIPYVMFKEVPPSVTGTHVGQSNQTSTTIQCAGSSNITNIWIDPLPKSHVAKKPVAGISTLFGMSNNAKNNNKYCGPLHTI